MITMIEADQKRTIIQVTVATFFVATVTYDHY
jgi:hypothetical protein